jgi:hypothetical protein
MKNQLFLIILKILKCTSSFSQFGSEHKRSPNLNEFICEKKVLKGIVYPQGWPNIYHFLNAQCVATYGGAVIDNSNKVYSELTYFPWGKKFHPVISFPFLGKRLKKIEKAIFIVTPEASNNFYHWHLDLVPRILLCKIAVEDFSSRHIIIHSDLKKYEKEFYEYLEIDPEKIICLNNFNVLPVSDLIVPTYTFDYDRQLDVYGDNSTKWKKKIFDYVKNNVFKIDDAVENHALVYLQRGENNRFGRNLIGEDKIIPLLKKIGFEIYNPINYSIKEQAEIISNAKCVVSIHGAAMSNIVYCKENTLIIELKSPFNLPNCFSNISKNFGLRYESIELKPIIPKNINIAKVRSLKANSLDLQFNMTDFKKLNDILDRIL